MKKKVDNKKIIKYVYINCLTKFSISSYRYPKL